MYHIFIFIFILLNFQPVSADLPDPPNYNEEYISQEIQTFYLALQNEIDLAEQKVAELIQEVQDQTDIFSDVRRAELQAAILMLNVKQTLVMNFIDTPSILFEEIRDKLLEILRKEFILEVDLMELQYLVDFYAANP